MMPSIRSRLDTLAERHQEVALLLAQPEVIGDNTRFRDLSREYAQLQPLADTLSRFDATVELAVTAEETENFPIMRAIRDVELTAADMAFVNGAA